MGHGRVLGLDGDGPVSAEQPMGALDHHLTTLAPHSPVSVAVAARWQATVCLLCDKTLGPGRYRDMCAHCAAEHYE